MLVKDLPFRQIFGSIIRPVVSEEKDRLLSLASMQELSAFIPNIDTQRNIDLLPIAFDACVINRGNKNGDLLDADIALAMYKTFVHKFIDTEHNRQKVIGVILTASLSEFGTNRPLMEEDVKSSVFPFNITLGGVLWKAVNEELCDLVEEANDPTSENFMKVSASWELGFSDYNIIELEQGDRNIEEGTIINDPDFISSIKKYLKCFGGTGVKDGKSYYRLPNRDVVAMGVGLTKNPAADVQGVVTKLIEVESKNIETVIAETITSIEEPIKKLEFISQQAENTVNERRDSIMKITSITDITDENLKQCTASVITQFIADELKKASDVYVAEKTQQANANQTLQATTETLSKTVQEMQASLENLTKEKEARAKVDAFNSRMTEVSASYDLPEDVAKIVVDDLRGLTSDEAFAAWKTKAATLFKPYSKESVAAAKAAKCKAEDEAEAKKALPFEKKGDKKDDAEPDKDGDDEKGKKDEKKDGKKDDKKEAKASTEAIAAAVEDAVDNGQKTEAGLPNSSSASAPGLREKFATAFAEENFVIKK